MKKRLILVSSDNMHGLNGGAKFVKMFHDNKEYFQNKNVSITVYSNSSGFVNQQIYVKSAKYKVKQLFKRLLDKTRFGRKYKFNLYLQSSKKVVRNIDKVDNETVYLLNDYMAAYCFFERFSEVTHSIFMMHNNGDLLSMLDKKILDDPKLAKELLLIERVIMEKSEKIVFVSNNACENFKAKNPQYSDKTITIYNGIPSTQNTENGIREYNHLEVVAVGTLGARKNQRAIIDAIKKIGDSTIKLTLVGGGDVDGFKKYVSESGLCENIDIVGSQQDVAKFLSKANLFVSASLNEGLPISAQEAMSFGLPLILSDVGGCSELLHGNGFLIKPSVDELYNAIKFYNDNKELLADHGKVSMGLFSEKFEMYTMFDNYIQLANELLINT